MKNLFYFLLVVVMVVMNSCYCGGGFNEPQVPFSSNYIVGVWRGASGATNHIGTYIYSTLTELMKKLLKVVALMRFRYKSEHISSTKMIPTQTVII